MSDPGYGSNIVVVLCRAEGSSNVGAVCRAMKTMGLSRLSLADCPGYDEPQVRERALSAFDLYRNASRFPDLAAALSPHTASAGFTRRTGRSRTPRFADVRDFAGDVAAAPAGAEFALVFGNERDGLTDDELWNCDLAVGIPSSGEFPSLNLSHAVQIAAWEMRKAAMAARSPEDAALDAGNARAYFTGSFGAVERPVAKAAATGAASRIADRLQEAGFFKIAGRPDAERFLSSVISRAGLSAGELHRFSGLFTKLAALEKHRNSQ